LSENFEAAVNQICFVYLLLLLSLDRIYSQKKLGLILINIFNHYSFGLLLSWFCQSPQSLSLILMLYFNKTFYWNKYHAWYVDFSVKTTRNWIQFE